MDNRTFVSANGGGFPLTDHRAAHVYAHGHPRLLGWWTGDEHGLSPAADWAQTEVALPEDSTSAAREGGFGSLKYERLFLERKGRDLNVFSRRRQRPLIG